MPRLSCWLMGWGALLVECGETAGARGHPVTGVVTRYGPAVEWAAAQGIPVGTRLTDLRGALRPDLLVSVNNDVVLSAHDLAMCRVMAVNLHSSPLPRYAGVHQTTWALLNGEPRHGVTWHEMTTRIDGGRILSAATFPVLPEDTTLSLDVRCHEHGLALFGPLLDDVAAGTITPTHQDLSARTYFPANRLFPAGGIVSWRQPADELDRWCRAGDFGRLDNRFGQPRILVGGTVVLLTKLRPADGASTAAPGTVLAIEQGRTRIATRTVDVEVSGLATPDGHRPPPGELFTDLGITVGTQLPEPENRALLADRVAASARAEPAWLDVLENVTPGPEPRHPLWLPRPGTVCRATTMLDRRAVAAVLAQRPGEGVVALLLAAWLVVLGGHGTPRFSDDRRRAAVSGSEALITRDVPVAVTPAESAPFAATVRATARWLAEQAELPGYARDMPARYPLHGVSRLVLPVVLAVTDRDARPEPAPDTAVVIGIDKRRLTCAVVATDHLGPAEDVARRFAAGGVAVNRLLATVADEPHITVAELRTDRMTTKVRAL